MAVHYRIRRTVIGLSKDSMLNNVPVVMTDWLEFNPRTGALEAKVVTKNVTDYYDINRYDANDFSKILEAFFKEPFNKDKVKEGDL